ncbi:hypothetical protein [Bradyrhizobium sp. RDM4]|uniref:hypothetical protein n=1 Tax=Bradyrhizobium sp. RDM4 TaxID=3378765 RepID=UPI0038FC1F2D
MIAQVVEHADECLAVGIEKQCATIEIFVIAAGQLIELQHRIGKTNHPRADDVPG